MNPLRHRLLLLVLITAALGMPPDSAWGQSRPSGEAAVASAATRSEERPVAQSTSSLNALTTDQALPADGERLGFSEWGGAAASDVPGQPGNLFPLEDDRGERQILPVFFQVQEGPELDLGLPLRPPPADPFAPPDEIPPPKWYDKMQLRGYSQFRINGTTRMSSGSAPAQHPADRSIDENATFLIRRARIILASEVSDHLFVYFQSDFSQTPVGSEDATHFAVIPDLYGDLFIDKERVHRIRVGQSKVPYGWENMQSSARRAPLDRNDAFNSGTRNERDLGVFYYWTPQSVQDVFQFINENGLKTSGNYGAFGVGVYAGQGGFIQELNDSVHFVSRFTWPFQFNNGQVLELSVQGYTGQYVVLGSPISPQGIGPSVEPDGTRATAGRDGHLDQRLGWTAVYYPQPLGFQTEWTIGRGPALNEDQTAVERSSLYGGYAMVLYKLDDFYGTWFPFVRWQYYRGGYKWARNAPDSEINELELGLEWDIRPEMRLTVMYTFTDRTNLAPMAAGMRSYDQFHGQLLRTQFQINY
jgi:hypothetical protein